MKDSRWSVKQQVINQTGLPYMYWITTYYRDANDRPYKLGLGGNVGPHLYHRAMINATHINFGDYCKVHVNSGLVDYTCTYIQRVKTPKFQCECISCENLFFCYAKIISMYVLWWFTSKLKKIYIYIKSYAMTTMVHCVSTKNMGE